MKLNDDSNTPEIIKQIISGTERVQQITGSYLQMLEQLRNRFQETLKPFIQVQQQIQKDLQVWLQAQSQFQARFQEFARRVIEAEKTWEKTTKTTKKAMIETGWWFTPSLMELPGNWITEVLIEALWNYENGKKAAITNLFKRIYHRDNYQYLKQTVEGWKGNSLFMPWMKVIKDALDAHCRKKYTLSIPALLPAAEGIATDFCKKNRTLQETGSS